jgi:antitoxin component YwqK of YwqJK toxin-antitoxin module
MFNHIIFIVFSCFISFNSNSQLECNESQLFLKEGKYYLNNTEFNGLVWSRNITKGQYEYCFEIKNGVPNGVYKKLTIDYGLNTAKHRDSSIIKFALNDIEMFKVENLKIIEDTVKARSGINELIIKIGGVKKLDKLSSKYIEGKLKGESLTLFESYLEKKSVIQKGRSSILANKEKIENQHKLITIESNKPKINQAILEEYYQINFIKNGTYSLYYSNNSINAKGEYLNNLQNGQWTYFFENGKIKADGSFKNGDGGNVSETTGIPRNGREGNWIFYHENGNKSQESNYLSGKLNRNSLYYFENGNKEEESNYSNDQLNGKRLIYYENGKLKEDLNYSNDQLNGKRLIYYDNGSLKEESFYRNGLKDGKVIRYFDNGKVLSRAEVTNGKLNGLVTFYNSEGIKLSEQFYKNDKQNGLKTTFFQNGFKENEATFVNDILHGPLKLYHDNGKIKLDMIADSLSKSECGCSGIANSYDENGKLIEKIEVSRNGDVKQLFKQKSEFEQNIEKEKNSKHNCSWCGRSFMGLGFEASDNSFIGGDKTCKTSSKMFVLIPELEKYFCSAKCAYEECIH